MKTMTKMLSVMVLGASFMITNQSAMAQNIAPFWSVTGNSNATSLSKLGTTNNIPLRLYTNNLGRMYISAISGNVGIGNVAPSSRLHVTGTTRLQGAVAIVGSTAMTGNTTVSGSLSSATFRMIIGGGLNKVLRSDATGNASWVTLSTLETDPQVGINTTNYLSKWNGSSLVTSGVFNNGNFFGLNATTSIGSANFIVKSPNTAGYGGMYLNQVGTGCKPFYGYAVNGASNTWTYLDQATSEFRIYNNGDRFAIRNTGSVNLNAAITSGVIPTDNNIAINNASNSRFPGISFYSSLTTEGGALYGKTFGGGNGINVAERIGGSFAPINASAFNVTSDRRMKKDIVAVDVAQYEQYLDKIRKIESATFFYNQETAQDRAVPHIGVIAQSLPAEVQAQMSETPSEQGEGRLGVSLVDMQGLLLVGIKALDNKIANLSTENVDKLIETNEALKAENQSLKDRMDQIETALQSCCMNFSGNSTERIKNNSGEVATMEQNTPNPFNTETVIRYYLPANSENAVLKVMSILGQEMINTPITNRGFGEIRISGNKLSAGTYTYTLIVNGKAAESKIMVLTN